MDSGAAVWTGAALLAVLVIVVAVVLVRARRRKQAAVLSRDEKLRRARQATAQINRGRRKTARGSLRGKGEGGSDRLSKDAAYGESGYAYGDSRHGGALDSGGGSGGGSD
jgi:hypothetical protein